MTKKKKTKSFLTKIKPKLKKGLHDLKNASFRQKTLLFLAFVAIILVGVGLYASSQQRTVDTEASTPAVQCTPKASACDIELMAQCLYGQDLFTEQITGCVETSLDINEDGTFDEADLALCKDCTSLPEYCDGTNSSCEASQVRQCATATKNMLFCDTTRNQCVYGFNPDLGCNTDQDCIDTNRGDTCVDRGLEENACTYEDGPPESDAPEMAQRITDVSCQTDAECTENLDISLCDGTEDINKDGKIDSYDEIACRVCQTKEDEPDPSPTAPQTCNEECNTNQACERACGAEFKCSNDCDEGKRCPAVMGNCVPKEQPDERCIPEGEVRPAGTNPSIPCCEGLEPYFPSENDQMTGFGRICLPPNVTPTPTPPQQCEQTTCMNDTDCQTACGTGYACLIVAVDCMPGQECPTQEPGSCYRAQTTCPLKSQGDANCDGDIDLLDFNEWRVEYRALVTEQPDTHTSDLDNDGNNWDSNFDGNVNADTSYEVDLTDFSIWRETYVGILLNNNIADDVNENSE